MYSIGDVFYLDDDYDNKVEFCNKHNYRIVEIESDEKGQRFQIKGQLVPTEEEIKQNRIYDFKAELAKIKEDIEQEVFGLVRDDFAEKKARAAEIINELRVLEGKVPREVNS